MAAAMDMNNWVDLPVPMASPGFESRYEPLAWALAHCPSYITNDAVQKQGVYYYRFYFGDEGDRMMFLLKWAGQ
jgi:hypothetical protein